MGRRAVVALCTLVGTARADHPPITNRDFAIDLYDGVALGNAAIVGMGGTAAASQNGTAGVLVNPSAIGVRQTTDHDDWSWDYHFDFLTGSFSSDYDNNGAVNDDSGASLLTLGIGGRYHDWSIAGTGTAQYTPMPGDLHAEAARLRVVVAKFFPQIDLSVGIGLQTGSFALKQDDGVALFSLTGTGGLAGATWVPRDTDLRIGAAIDGPITKSNVQAQGCDPGDCHGYILPDRVRAPWRLVAGAAYRIGPTAWNHPMPGPWRDEAAWTLAADIVVTGATADGYGIEAFGMQQLQRSGRNVNLSVRGGAEYEWLPGRLRVRAGSYWEPQRFDEVGGRLHGTLGVDVHVLDFHAWGPRRGRVGLTADLASRYRNIGASIGLWH